jgi:hypothetical protein
MRKEPFFPFLNLSNFQRAILNLPIKQATTLQRKCFKTLKVDTNFCNNITWKQTILITIKGTLFFSFFKPVDYILVTLHDD